MKGKPLYRQLIALIFLAAFVTQTFSRSFVVADYYTNTNAYAKNCVNKAKPKLQCNGKCQLMKKLQQEEKKDQQNPQRKIENKAENILSTKSFFATAPTKVLISYTTKKILPSSDGKSIGRHYDIFHPPRVA